MDIYPPRKDIVEALQDPGKKMSDKKSAGMKTCFPLIEKLALKIFNLINSNFNKPEFLPKNITRAKMPLVKKIVLLQKHGDRAEIHPFFHSYAKDGKVYLLKNDECNCDIDLIIDLFQDYFNTLQNQKK